MNDIYCYIFGLSTITAKRSITCVSKGMCKLFRDKLLDADLEFQNMINRKKFLSGSYYSGFYNTMYKRTIELIYDNCAHLIPDSYIVVDNQILRAYTNIYKKLGKNGDFEIIDRIFRSKIKDHIDEF